MDFRFSTIKVQVQKSCGVLVRQTITGYEIQPRNKRTNGLNPPQSKRAVNYPISVRQQKTHLKKGMNISSFRVIYT